MPGKYNVTFFLETSNNSSANLINLQVSAEGGKYSLASYNLSGSQFYADYIPLAVTLNLTVNNLYNAIEFRGINTDWHGVIIFKGVMLAQQ